VVVFHTGALVSTNNNSKKGIYDIDFQIPSDLLNAGGYYFKLIVAMYTKEASEKETTPTPFVYYFVAVIAILLNIIIGIFPNIILNLLGA
jgi:hypothetical protein